MPRSNYPGGFREGVSLRNIPVDLTNAGKVFWVGNSSVAPANGIAGSNGNPGTYNRPLGTIQGAIDKTVSGRGDVIYVMPGHSETIESAGAIALSKSNLSIIGLGYGDTRAKVIYGTAATASITVTAAGCLIQGLTLEAAFADITRAINVTAEGCRIFDVHFMQQELGENFVDFIDASSTTDNNADNLWIEGCRGYTRDAAHASFVELNADVDGFRFNDNFLSSQVADPGAAVIECATGKDLRECEVLRNICDLGAKASGDLLIDNDTTVNTGVVAYNLIGHSDTVGEILIDCDGVALFENYGTAVVTASGYLLPAVDS